MIREAAESPLLPVECREYESGVATARAELGKEAVAAAWAEGRAMTMEQAVIYALEESGI